MTPFVRAALPYALLALSLLATKCVYDRGQRQAGVLQERARVADSTVKALRASVREGDVVYRQDTIRMVRRVTRWRDSVVSRVDTLADTVRVPVEVVRWVVAEADSTIQACRSVVVSCEQRVAVRDTLIGALTRQNALTREQLRRNVRRTWAERLMWAGAVFLVSR